MENNLKIVVHVGIKKISERHHQKHKKQRKANRHQMMSNHDLDGRGVVDRLHHFLVAGRTHYPDDLLADLLDAVSTCDMRLQRSAQQRIQLEELFHRVAEIGREHLDSPASQAS